MRTGIRLLGAGIVVGATLASMAPSVRYGTSEWVSVVGAPPDAGRYLSVYASDSRANTPRELVHLLTNPDDSMAPLPPRTCTDSGSRSEASAPLGADRIHDREMDLAWVLANRIAGRVVPWVPYLVVEEANPVTGLRPGDRILSVDGLPASMERWRRSVTAAAERAHTPAASPVVRVGIAEASGIQELRVDLRSTGDDLGLVLVEWVRVLSARPLLTVTPTITGASGGLVYTLVYLDSLGKGELTAGLDVAATGQVRLDGSVLPVGRVAAKAEAADVAAVDVLFVPEANLAKAAVSGPEVVGVRRVEDAVGWLCERGADDEACGLPTGG